MVKLLELDDDGNSLQPPPPPPPPPPPHIELRNLSIEDDNYSTQLANASGIFTLTAFYPIVSEIATGLDLTSLDQLSQTSRHVRANLLQYRTSLISRTLRCCREGSTGSKFPCARDLVGPCQRCRTIYCRNCIVKPKQTSLISRHRRLCKSCVKAPLERHLLSTEVALGEDSSGALQQICSQPKPAYHGACNCVEMMWFCEPCDRQLGSEDTSYMRGWSWRRRYSHIGVGIGEGEQGVICGREGQCLAMSCLEVEVEIDSEQFDHPNDVADTSARSWSNTGYLTQEIEGIGGVVKKKVKKRVPVGHVVKEYEDERMSGGYLHREQTGKVRSWCAHCNKVILGEKDKNTAVEDPSGHIRTNSNSSSSTGSSMLMAWQ